MRIERIVHMTHGKTRRERGGRRVDTLPRVSMDYHHSFKEVECHDMEIYIEKMLFHFSRKKAYV